MPSPAFGDASTATARGRAWPIEIPVLREALAKCRHGSPLPLLSALGFEPLSLAVPRPAFADFGLDESERLKLEVAARHSDFLVFHIVLEGGLDPDAIRRVAGALYRHNPTRRALLVFRSGGDDPLVLASWGLGPGPMRLLKLWIDPAAPRLSELDILAGLALNGAATTGELALAHARALDREGVTRRFFNEFRRHRAELAAGLEGIPQGAAQDRLDLALILLGRLLFLYFIQKKGWLDGDRAYLRHRLEIALDQGRPFFRRHLKPLFFGALNKPPEARSKLARQLGELPYLNGGLFQHDGLERKYPRLNVPDDCFLSIFRELLDKYQFTLREGQSSDRDVAVDPEMLGKVFEGLMAGSFRGRTGAFYTPRSLVDSLVVGALSAHLSSAASCDRQLIDALIDGRSPDVEPALRQRLVTHAHMIRLLDPAAGSGAFLLAALQHLESLRDALEGRPPDSRARFERRQEIIRANLHGVDINATAVRLCELRLWLALVVDLEVGSIAEVPPLPNLDINIRQGDALVDPVDFCLQLGDLDRGRLASYGEKEIRRLSRHRRRYFHAAGPAKSRAQRSLHKAERDLAVRFLSELSRQIDERRGDLSSAAQSRDLFGRRAGLSRTQKRSALALRRRKSEVTRLLGRIREADELPFFSFPIHFAEPGRPDAGFQIVVGNPPWVRPHHWTHLSRSRLRERYEFLRNAGWHTGTRLSGAGRGFGAQLDLSALFLERSLELLDEGGTLGFMVPAKLARGLSAGALRRQLLVQTTIIRIEDCALATRRLFEATTYPMSLLMSRGAPDRDAAITVRVHDRRGEHLDFKLAQSAVPLIGDDPESPWVLAPPAVRGVINKMRRAGPPIGRQPGRRPSRGIFTGANDVFVGEVLRSSSRARVAMHLSGSKVEIESDCVRPVLRGEDIAPWQYRPDRAIVWTHDDIDGRVLARLPEAAESHLRKHRLRLQNRVDLRPGQPYWTLFRTGASSSRGRRVVWRDIAARPEAAVVQPRIPFLTCRYPVVSLNTVYQIAAVSEEDAHLLAAVLNSTVARAYLKAFAERASGGYFRFLGWTVALLPFPVLPDAAASERCIRISQTAHAAAGLDDKQEVELDEHVARLYRLSRGELQELREFDARLANPEHQK